MAPCNPICGYYRLSLGCVHGSRNSPNPKSCPPGLLYRDVIIIDQTRGQSSSSAVYICLYNKTSLLVSLLLYSMSSLSVSLLYGGLFSLSLSLSLSLYFSFSISISPSLCILLLFNYSCPNCQCQPCFYCYIS